MGDIDKWELKQFVIINTVAKMVYDAIQGGIDQNFYYCWFQYEEGVFGWIKEKTAFETAIEIYDEMTSNNGWDIINSLESDHQEYLFKLKADELKQLKLDLEDVE